MKPNMSVRKINKSHVSLTGIVHSKKNGVHNEFESSLEQDLIYRLEFDYNIKSFDEQPVTIEYKGEDGKNRRYTPDFLVTYRKDIEPAKWFKPMLCEVKYREELKENWKKYKPKFKAANEYAAQNDWTFKILTEVEIRNDYLYNAKFLLPYKNATIDMGLITTLHNAMTELVQTTPNELIQFASRDKNRRAELLYTLWLMVACGDIRCDLSRRITMNTEIWSTDNIPTFIKP